MNNKRFIKASELQLLNGGYLSDKEGNPITNVEFVKLQKQAEYVVTFAELAKTKDFVGKKADSIEDLKKEVSQKLIVEQKNIYFETPAKPQSETIEQLTKEALNFLKFNDEKENVSKLNEYMQDFNLLLEFETYGLFFENGIVKLNKIYTIEDVKNAVLEVKDLL